MDRQKYLNSVARDLRVCNNCGKKFKPKKSDRITYCSRECSFTSGKHGMAAHRIYPIVCYVWIVNCEICGKLYIKRRKSKRNFCSSECKKKNMNIYMFKRGMTKKGIVEKICKGCGIAFIPKYGNKRRSFCSDSCADKFGSFKNDKERALYFGVKYEKINIYSIFRKANYCCQICGKKTPQEKRGTYDLDAPEIDHIIPMSKGGGHIKSNVQLACRECNNKKSNKT